jgi:hypothetical protein
MNNDPQTAFDFDLTVDEMRVLAILPRGAENAVSMPTLAGAMNMSTRQLQDLIAHLIESHGQLICSACGKNHGYYMPASEEEYRTGVRQLKNRIISLAKRMRALDRTAYEQIFGQGELEL